MLSLFVKGSSAPAGTTTSQSLTGKFCAFAVIFVATVLTVLPLCKCFVLNFFRSCFYCCIVAICFSV